MSVFAEIGVYGDRVPVIYRYADGGEAYQYGYRHLMYALDGDIVLIKEIRKRARRFNNKLYLEIGGKLLQDLHAARILPGFEPDSKLKMLLSLKEALACPPSFR